MNNEDWIGDYYPSARAARPAEKKKILAVKRLTAEDVELFGNGAFPDQLLPLLNEYWAVMQPVYTGSAVVLIPGDMDADPGLEYLFWVQNSGRGVLLFDQVSDGQWRCKGSYRLPADSDKVLEAIRSGKIAPVPSRYKDLALEGWSGRAGLRMNQAEALRTPDDGKATHGRD